MKILLARLHGYCNIVTASYDVRKVDMLYVLEVDHLV